jgi:hypothetical protein
LAAELAAALGYHGKTLTSSNVLIPVAYYLRSIGSPEGFCSAPKFSVDRAKLRQWLVAGLLKSVFSAKTDTLLSAVRNAIRLNTGTGFPSDAIERALLEHNVSIRFLDDELDTLLASEYGRRNTFSILAALYPSLNTQFQFHLDHLFPKSAFHKVKLRAAGFKEDEVVRMQALVNQVPNLQFLEGLANQSKLDTAFDAWIAPIRKDSLRWAQYQQQHAIPDLSSYTLADFENFFRERRQLMLQRLKAVLC